MAFSLSPDVTVREFNLTGYVPNLPSARTGLVLRANKGPSLEVVAITNENDLVSMFGYPDSSNYQDWFQAWNFLQYASSLYVCRAMNTTVTNAALSFNGDTSTPYFQSNLYNSKIAEQTLEGLNVSSPLYLYKKDVTSKQVDAIAICSKPSNWAKQIGLEYFATISGVNGSNTVSASDNTLVKGSMVLLNGNKLATVSTVDGFNNITFDRAVSAQDVAVFYMNATSSSSQFNGAVYKWTASKVGFNAKIGSLFTLGGTAQYYINGISNFDNDNYLIYATNTLGNQTNPGVTAAQIITSSSMWYLGTTSTSAASGATVIKMQPGFVLEEGLPINFGADVGLYNIINVDNLNNQITLSRQLTINVTAGTPLFNSNGYKSVTLPINILGINFFDQIYDASVIVKTKTQVFDPSGNAKNIYVQSLASFSKLFTYQPDWNNGEFALVLLAKDPITNLYKLNKTWSLSYNSTAKDRFGNNIFAEQVMFKDGQSPVYAKVGDITLERPNTSSTRLPKFVNDSTSGTNIYPKTFTAGNWEYNGYGFTLSDINNAEELFADPETFSINILLPHELDLNGMPTIAETRKDCVAINVPFDYTFLSTNSANVCTQYMLDNFGTQTEADNKLFTTFGTYSATYGNMKYQYDKYNDVNRWVNLAGDIAGLYAQTDATNDPWWAPAGSSRGVIKNAIKLAFNPNKQNRNDLYVNGINPVMAIEGEGNAVVWGQKTATDLPSAMDRVNVRRLLIFLEKAIATASRLGLFEFNDAFTRNRLFGIIDQFLRSVKSKRGLYDYKVVIDESNNTSQVIDANGLVIDIYLKPTRVAEAINLNMIVVPSGVSFNEVVGKF